MTAPSSQATPTPRPGALVFKPRSDRCQWCGVFVAAGTPYTIWSVEVHPDWQQVRHEPNIWARVLCPKCSEHTTVVSAWKRPASLSEAMARAVLLGQEVLS